MQNEHVLIVDGKRFHYMWLRDNCLCAEFLGPNSYQKIYDISEAQSPPKPLSVVEKNEKLTITLLGKNNLFTKVYFPFLG